MCMYTCIVMLYIAHTHTTLGIHSHVQESDVAGDSCPSDY